MRKGTAIASRLFFVRCNRTGGDVTGSEAMRWRRLGVGGQKTRPWILPWIVMGGYWIMEVRYLPLALLGSLVPLGTVARAAGIDGVAFVLTAACDSTRGRPPLKHQAPHCLSLKFHSLLPIFHQSIRPHSARSTTCAISSNQLRVSLLHPTHDELPPSDPAIRLFVYSSIPET
ncbi:hypothetical protein F4801DRAFT_88065 [Xylaria longipes]|nr:hypothetical protein F4801DRAFT_88065 [Xylaria longipes]